MAQSVELIPNIGGGGGAKDFAAVLASAADDDDDRFDDFAFAGDTRNHRMDVEETRVRAIFEEYDEDKNGCASAKRHPHMHAMPCWHDCVV